MPGAALQRPSPQHYHPGDQQERQLTKQESIVIRLEEVVLGEIRGPIQDKPCS